MLVRIVVSLVVGASVAVAASCAGDQALPDVPPADAQAGTEDPVTAIPIPAAPLPTIPGATTGSPQVIGPYYESQAAEFSEALVGDRRTIINTGVDGVPQRDDCDDSSAGAGVIYAGSSVVISEMGADACAGWVGVNPDEGAAFWIMLRHLDAPDVGSWDGPVDATWHDLFATFDSTDRACTDQALAARELQEASAWPLFGVPDPEWSLLLAPCGSPQLFAGLLLRDARVHADLAATGFDRSQERCLAAYGLESFARSLLAPAEAVVAQSVGGIGLARCAPNVLARVLSAPLGLRPGEHDQELGCIAASEDDLVAIASAPGLFGEIVAQLFIRCAEDATFTWAVANMAPAGGSALTPAGETCLKERAIPAAVLMAVVDRDQSAFLEAVAVFHECAQVP